MERQKESIISTEHVSQEKNLLEIETPDNIHQQESWRSKVFNSRFVNLFLFLISCLVIALPTHTFTPINSIIQTAFGYSKIAIAANTLIFSISHPALAFVANWIIDKYGLKTGSSIGALFLISGVWLRVLIKQSLVPVLIGSFLAAFGSIFIINSPSKFATTWFRTNMVARITALGVLFTIGSQAFGIVIPPFFVHESSTQNQVERMLIYQAIIVSVPSILMLILFRNKPVNPPSYAASIQHSTSSYKQDIKKLFSNKNYLLLLLGMSMIYGVLSCFTTVIQFIILPFQYKQPSKLASNVLLTAIIAGVIGSFIFTFILKRTKAYKKILILAMIASGFELVCLVFTLDSHKIWFILLVNAQVGFLIVPQLPIFLDFGCQIAFPIGEASSSGYLLAGGQLTGFLSSLIALNFLDSKNKTIVYVVVGILGFMCLIGVIGVSLLKEDLRRSNYEKDRFVSELEASGNK